MKWMKNVSLVTCKIHGWLLGFLITFRQCIEGSWLKKVWLLVDMRNEYVFFAKGFLNICKRVDSIRLWWCHANPINTVLVEVEML